MQSGQVSIWVPIVVGFIGLLGVIAGQLVNAWREDRRWQWERQREDLRWQREKEKESSNRDHDYDKYWLDKKVEIYGQLLHAARLWGTSAYSASRTGGQSKQVDEFADHDRNFSEVRSLIEIFGSEALRSQVAKLDSVHTEYFFDVVGVPASSDRRTSMERDLDAQYAKVLSQVRAEIRVAPGSGGSAQ